MHLLLDWRLGRRSICYKSSCLTKAEEISLPYYLPIVGGRIIGFIPFLMVLVLCEMQLVSSRIWTRVAVSISYDDNHYTRGTSKTMPHVVLSSIQTESNLLTLVCWPSSLLLYNASLPRSLCTRILFALLHIQYCFPCRRKKIYVFEESSFWISKKKVFSTRLISQWFRHIN